MRASTAIAYEYKVYAPPELNLRSILPSSLHCYIDAARYFIHTIIVRRNIYGIKTEYVNLKEKYLRKFFSSQPKFAEIRNALIKADVIECDNDYAIGGKSLGYRLTPHWHALTPRLSYIKNPAYVYKINEIQIENRCKLKLTQHRYIEHCLSGITINHAGATTEIEEGLDLADKDHYGSWIRQQVVVDAIKRGDWAMTTCEFGRVYNGLTYLKRSLRSYLSFDEVPLISIDVSCCHPLLIGITCKEEYKKTRGEMAAIPPDMERFISLCQEGKLYDELINRCNNTNHDRTWVKKTILSQVFYGENNYRGPLVNVMNKEFPSIMKIARSIKREDYAKLSHRMLRLESQIVIDTAVLKCADKGIWIGTIHDCMVCLPDDVEIVTDIMAQAFAEYDITPHVKTKPLAEDAVKARYDVPIIAKRWETADGLGTTWGQTSGFEPVEERRKIEATC